MSRHPTHWRFADDRWCANPRYAFRFLSKYFGKGISSSLSSL
jgi:hypothetical protein